MTVTKRRPKGIVCPLATPLTEDEQVDEAALRRLLRRITPHLDGLFLLGTTGEFAFLTERTKRQVVGIALEEAGGQLPLYVVCAETGTRRSIEMARSFEHAGVDGLVAMTPYYYPVQDQQEIERHFLSFAEEATRPVLLYNIPQNTGNHLRPETVARLAEHPNIVGMKDSWNDFIQFQTFLARAKQADPDFAVLQGNETLALAVFTVGGDGIVSGLGNIAPELLQALHRAVEQREVDQARALQREVAHLAEIFERPAWIAAVKEAIAAQGYGSGRVAQPLPRLTDEEREFVRQRVAEHSLVGSGVTKS